VETPRQQGTDRLETPERVDLHVELAGIGSRGLAQIVDLALLMASWILVLLILLAMSPVLRFWSAVLAMAFTLFSFLAYFVLFEAFWDGQTPGKRLLKLRVQREGGYPVGWTEVLLRNLMRLIDSFLGYAVGLISMLLTERSQRIGDLVAGTVVVRESTGGLAELERMGYGAPAVRHSGAPELSGEEYELVHDYFQRKGWLDPEAAVRVQSSLAAALRARLAQRGVLSSHWQALSDESLLLNLLAVYRGEPIPFGPLSAAGRGAPAADSTETPPEDER